MSGDPSVDDRASSEAADWFAKLNSRVITTDAIEGFAKWRRDPGNLAAYQTLERVWRGAEPLEADPDIKLAVQEAIARPGKAADAARRRATRARWTWGLSSLAVLAVAGAVLGPSLLNRVRGAVYETPVGVQSSFRVSDGTLVRLDTGSRIAVHITPARREVRLEHGQAYFTVVHDPSRPFQVVAGDTQVRDIGTTFDVRLDGRRARVTLVEGVVQVRNAAEPSARTWTLHPGQQLQIGSASPAALKPVDAVAATSWTSGQLTFRGVPLAEAVREVSRYSHAPLSLDDDQIAQIPMNGVFNTGDVPAFVSAVTTLFPLMATPRPDGGVALTAKSPPA